MKTLDRTIDKACQTHARMQLVKMDKIAKELLENGPNETLLKDFIRMHNYLREVGLCK